MMFKKKKHVSYSTNLSNHLKIISFTISLFIILFLLVFYSSQINTFISEEYQETNESALMKSSNTIEKNLDRTAAYINTVKNNPVLISSITALEDEDVSPVLKYHAFTELNDYLFYLTKEMPAIEDIWIITESKQYSTSGSYSNYTFNGSKLINDERSNRIYTAGDFLNNLSIQGISSRHLTERNNSDLKDKVFFSTNLNNSSMDHMGIAIFIIDNQDLMSSILNSDFYQIRHNGHVIYSGTEFSSEYDHLQDQFVLADETKSVASDFIPSYDMTVFLESSTFNSINFSVFIGAFLLSAAALYLFIFHFTDRYSVRIIAPIKQLIEDMVNTSDANYPTPSIKKWSTRFSFREKLTGYLAFTIILPVFIFSVVHYLFISSLVIENLKDINYSEHQSKVSIIESELDAIKMLLATFPVDSFLDNDTEQSDTQIEDDSLQRIISSYIDPLVSINLSIYDRNGALIYSSSNSAFRELNYSDFVSEPLPNSFLINNRLTSPSVSTLEIALPKLGMMHGDDVNRPLIIASINESFLSGIPSIEDASSEYITLADENLWNLTTLDRNTFSDEAEGSSSDSVTFSSAVSFNNLIYHSSFNVNQYTGEVRNVFLKNSYILFILVILVFALSYGMTLVILEPFKKIIETYNTKGNLKDQIKYFEGLSSINEINQIRKGYKDSLFALDQSIEEKLRYQKQLIKDKYKKREIQLFALQNQVKPHFLYNSLDNLLFLVESDQTEKSLAMINSLSRFFQFVTNRESIKISLAEEITFTKNYINIMRERFENFDVHWNIDETLLDSQVLKLIMQPIVENSIHHGVRHSDETVSISISIYREDNLIVLCMKDDAGGIDEETLSSIRRELENSSYNKSGLFNVADRLELHYGEEASLLFESIINQGTTVTIQLPLHKSTSKNF